MISLFFFVLNQLAIQADQFHIDAPTSMLINESTEDFWTRYKIDRTYWTAKANSEHTTSAGNEGPISNILDGNPNTLWHSKYDNGGTGWHDERAEKNDPFNFTIDLKRDTTFRAFSYMPRQTGDPNGLYLLYEFYVAHTEAELNEKVLNSNYVAKGFIDQSTVSSRLSTLVILESSVNGRFVALRSLDHDKYGTCAEFNLYRDPYQPTPTPIAFYIDEDRDHFWRDYRIDRSGWTATANSEQTKSAGLEGPISNILDGRTDTLWHSKYNNNGAGGHDDRQSTNDPFQFEIDLGKITAFRAFAYRPRTGENGRFEHFEFFIANTRDELNNKIQSNNYSAIGDIDKTVGHSTMAVFNYVETGRFVALRSKRGQEWGTCSEFNLFSDPPSLPSFSELKYIDESNEPYWTQYKINRDGWTITANSEHTTDPGNEGPVTNIIDGDKTTLWHTKYSGGGPGGHDERQSDKDPFQFTINLGKDTTFRAFTYMPRSSPNGKFRHYEFYAALTEEELNTLIENAHYLSKGLIDKSRNESSLVILDRVVTAHYIALLSLNHDSYATCSEFNLYSDPPVSTSTPTPTPLPTPASSISTIDLPNEEFWLSYRIDRRNWRISANSEQVKTGNGEGPVTHILDGNTGTIWHSRYNQNTDTGHDDRSRTSDPYQFAIDMKQQETIIGFTYQKRQTGENGEIEKYEFYVGETSEELFMKIRNKFYLSKGNFNKNEMRSYFVRFDQPITGQYVALLSLDKNHATCCEFNVFRYPPASPTASPSQSMTPTAAPPGSPPDIVVYDPQDTDGRIEVKQEFHQYVYVKVDASNFTNVTNPEDGGAIHIDNAGIQLDKTAFNDCKSEGAGGAIYISNTYSMVNNITFENLQFENNEAQYGGAIYVYSGSYNNLVVIKYCAFTNNKATQAMDPKTKSGGSAIFLTARKGDIGHNTFRSHDEQDTIFRIYNKYDKETQAMNLDYSGKDGFKVSECIFEKNKCLKASLFYSADRNGSPFELINCQFLDNLEKDAHYIDGLSLSRNSPKLSVKRCKFSSNLKNSFNENNNFMSIDLNDQVFNSYSNEDKKESFASLTIATAVVVSLAVVAIVSIVIIFIVVKKNKNNDNANDGHEMNTMTQDLLNEDL